MNQFLFHNNDKSFNLPIIQKLINTYKQWQSFLPNFPQPVRQTIVHKIDVYLTDVIENIYKAAHTTIKENKNNYLNNASNSLDLLKFFLFIIWETKILDNNKFALLSENIHWIGKMLGNWIKSLDKNNKG